MLGIICVCRVGENWEDGCDKEGEDVLLAQVSYEVAIDLRSLLWFEKG